MYLRISETIYKGSLNIITCLEQNLKDCLSKGVEYI